ncbi:hypothetical protein BJ322DRAFT_1110630 [Thelephora terrestris]|uniref:AAA+ ATPase domain-containing protein n=1 Tax=Thelephora terrestris TaxID=56493 RepID=A0A9P6HA06_9AGAM|nr:hypothetical protein BJ322DRAFT_1110630 [Thelephora terrestris]
MDANSPQPVGHDGDLSLLTTSIGTLNLAERNSSIKPAKNVFGSARALLAAIRDSTANEQDYVKLGLSCVDVCQALDRGLNGRRMDDLNNSILGAIEKLTTTVGAIQKKIAKQGERNPVSHPPHAKDDKETIAAWGRDLDRILYTFTVELSLNNHMILLDIRRDVQASQGGTEAPCQPTQASIPLGELPPPRPRACFGRDGLIEKIVGLVDSLNHVALIGAAGIGKTSVALAVLHHERIKRRFGDNRRFIRCDKFPASRSNFLCQLSKVIGAGLENPEDLAPFRPFLSSREMFIVLDNAESILDPQGTDAQEIYTMVKELSQFSNICLGITSRISNVPPHCKRLEIPTLSMEAACEVFYSIYGDGDRSRIINDLLRRLDFHALSITLLATTASNNKWDYDQLAKEWDEQRAQVLQTDYNESLAATIELSLASPTFRKLGPNARDLLGVVAFFPQGIDEKNLKWFFPTIPNRKKVLDKFCFLSLAYRSGDFITMLAPIRDYLRPRDPRTSPLLRAIKDGYFARMSVDLNPNEAGFGESQWIKSEDINVEQLLDVFTSLGLNSPDVWDACVRFMRHLYWQKPRQIVLGPKIEALPNNHPSKAECLFELSQLFALIGNDPEAKRLLVLTLALDRARGDEFRIALTLRWLSQINLNLGLAGEGMQQAEEALEILRRLGDTLQQANCLDNLARLLLYDGQLDAAEDAVSHKIVLLSLEKGQDFLLCQSHCLLGAIYRSKGEKEQAIYQFETALTITSSFDWQGELFWIHYEMARLFRDRDEFDDANAHIGQAKSHTADDAYNLGRGMEMQAWIWHGQCRLEDARSEALHALEIYERLGAAKDVGDCRELLQLIEGALGSQISGGSGSSVRY